ncbi:MAG: hypothetical protein ACRENK_02750 [Gemmatimonadaceae bacterium]
MLIATPTDWLRRNHLIEEDGKLVAEIDGSAWQEQASATVGTATYALYRETLFTATYVIRRAGQVVARARRQSIFSPQFDVTWGEQTLVLRRLSIWLPTFGVFKGYEQIGTIKRLGFLYRRGTVDGASSLPLEIRVFLLWIALMTWRRSQ